MGARTGGCAGRSKIAPHFKRPQQTIRRDDYVLCATCGLCARQRDAIVGFPAHDVSKRRVSEAKGVTGNGDPFRIAGR